MPVKSNHQTFSGVPTSPLRPIASLHVSSLVAGEVRNEEGTGRWNGMGGKKGIERRKKGRDKEDEGEEEEEDKEREN